MSGGITGAGAVQLGVAATGTGPASVHPRPAARGGRRRSRSSRPGRASAGRWPAPRSAPRSRRCHTCWTRSPASTPSATPPPRPSSPAVSSRGSGTPSGCARGAPAAFDAAALSAFGADPAGALAARAAALAVSGLDPLVQAISPSARRDQRHRHRDGRRPRRHPRPARLTGRGPLDARHGPGRGHRDGVGPGRRRGHHGERRRRPAGLVALDVALGPAQLDAGGAAAAAVRPGARRQRPGGWPRGRGGPGRRRQWREPAAAARPLVARPGGVRPRLQRRGRLAGRVDRPRPGRARRGRRRPRPGRGLRARRPGRGDGAGQAPARVEHPRPARRRAARRRRHQPARRRPHGRRGPAPPGRPACWPTWPPRPAPR